MNNSITKQTSLFVTTMALSVFLLGAIHSVSAQDAPGTASRVKHISLVDLDLSTPAGAQAARARLQQEVRTLCAQLGDRLDLSHRATYLECVDKATATTDRHLDALMHRIGNVRTAANQ